jgi:hypothetical protein
VLPTPNLLGFFLLSRLYSLDVMELFSSTWMSIFRNDYEMLLALDTDNYRHRGASRERVSQLPVTTLIVSFDFSRTVSLC